MTRLSDWMQQSAMTSAWDELRRREEAKPYWDRLQKFLGEERAKHQILPAEGTVFAALDATPFDEVKVVILGQDPYPTPGHAHGLAFSVPEDVRPLPLSLANIFKELTDDRGVPQPSHGCLESWARQGVLLLNTTLTVRSGARKTHSRAGWWRFTDEVIKQLGSRPEPTVFMLWGAPARKRAKHIGDGHLVIQSSHPSPLSANRSSHPFLTSRPFSRANTFLERVERGAIDWSVPDRTD